MTKYSSLGPRYDCIMFPIALKAPIMFRHPLRKLLNRRYASTSTKPAPHAAPTSSRFSFAANAAFWRSFSLGLAGFYIPFYYINKTTCTHYGIEGDSMYPLLRPSLSEAEALLKSRAATHGKKRKTRNNGPQVEEVQGHGRDRILVLPPIDSMQNRRPFFSAIIVRTALLLGLISGDYQDYNFRLADQPLSEADGDGTKSNLERGMVVLFQVPYNPERGVVKRIVGLEGDIVVPAPEGSGANWRDRRRMRSRWQEGNEMDDISSGRWIEGDVEDGAETIAKAGVLVPYGHVWVEGVNQAATVDSNDYGPISKSLITGVATRIIWPLGRSMAWEQSWEDDCHGRVFKKDVDGVFRIVRRLDKGDLFITTTSSGDLQSVDEAYAM
jgi:signal peptidase I